MDPWEIFNLERAKFSGATSEYDFPICAQPKQRSHGATKLKTRTWEQVVYQTADDWAPEEKPFGRIGIEVLFLSTKPVGDLSNCIKTLEDALNRRAYHDDNQIDYINCVRAYGPNYTDRTLIRVIEKA